jgi:hypothetical protein
MPKGRAVDIELTKDERGTLERQVRRRTSAAGLAMRSRIVLLAAEGLNNGQIAERVGASLPTVFVGVELGLEDVDALHLRAWFPDVDLGLVETLPLADISCFDRVLCRSLLSQIVNVRRPDPRRRPTSRPRPRLRQR